MAVIILRRPEELELRDRMERENRKRARQGNAQLMVHERCACGCGEMVPQEGRTGIAQFFVNDNHYQAMVKRTATRLASMRRDGAA